MAILTKRASRVIGAALLCLGILFVSPAQAGEITGAGSTFVYPVLSKWAADYAALTGAKVNYQSVGSAAGIAQIKAGAVDFGASDKPLDPEELSKAVGEGTSVQWPSGVGENGNEGVVGFVGQTPYTIGYVEYAYAVRNKMTLGLVQNSAGRFVAPDALSFKFAAASADWANAKDFDLVVTNSLGLDAYPITATTFVLMDKRPKNAAQSEATLKFFKWALENGQRQAAELDYASLPSRLVAQIESYWSQAIEVSGY